MGLLNLIPGFEASPIGSWWNQNSSGISSALAGTVGHGNDPRAILKGAMGLPEYGRSPDETNERIEYEKQIRAEKLNQEAMQQNVTRQRIAEWGAEYQPWLDALDGGMPATEVWSGAIKQKMGGATADASSYSMTPVFLQDADGNQQAAQMSGSGGILINGKVLPGIPEGWKVVARPENLDTVNVGGRFNVFDPNSGTFTPGPVIQGTPSQNLDVTLNPDGTRAATPIGGTEQDREARNVRTKAQSAFGAYNAKTDNMLSTIDKAKQESNFGNTGVLGFLGTLLPGFWATDYQKRLNTIAAYTGFKELQDMRDASPTGGALGQVTEKELELLQSVIVSVAQSQSEARLDENLKVLEDFLRASRERVKAAYEAEFSGAGGGGAMPDPLGIR